MYPHIRELAADGIPVSVWCRVLNLARQPYDRWLQNPLPDRQLETAYATNAVFDAHAQPTVETGITVFFADPQSPWQRGTNENTNGLRRLYFPNGADLARWSTDEIEAVASELNVRLRKILGWKTPAEAFDDHLRSLQQAGVATTG